MRVYKYGLLRPTTNADLVHEQIKIGHKYRNKLIELEIKRRDLIRAEVAKSSVVEDDFTDAKLAVEKFKHLDKLLKQKNAQHRSKRHNNPDLKKDHTKARKEKTKAIKKLEETRRKVLKKCKETIKVFNDQYIEEEKKVRSECAPFWGTYQVIEDAMKRSRKSLPLWDGLESNNPKFRRFNGIGRVSIQLQKDVIDKNNGMNVDLVFGTTDTRLQVAPVPEEAWYSPIRSVRRKKSRTVLKMRIGSEGRAPIWAEWPMIMHRPLPDNGRIKRVTVNFRKIGPREEWTADFFINDSATLHEQYEVSGAIGLDVGWRLMDDGSLRVAFWEDDEGEKGEFRLSPTLMGAFKKADDLRSIRDKNRDEIKEFLIQHFSKNPMPSWMLDFVKGKEDSKRPTNKQACVYLSKWKSIAKLTKLVQTWKEKGITKRHQKAYNRFEDWRYHDFHLWQWETSQRKKAERRRKDNYRVLASKLSKQYHTLVLENFDLRKVARKKAADDDSLDIKAANHNRFVANISELRLVLRNAFEKCGEIELVKAVNTTKICFWCGFINNFDQAKNLIHQCYSCGVVWDQDDNASTNIRRRRKQG